MTFNQIKQALYATYLTNYFGLKLKNNRTSPYQKRYRIEYSKTLFDALNLEVYVKNKEKLPKDGQFLLISNHKSVIDPLIIEIALEDTNIFGYWVSKKELYNSFFFGLFVRNAGTILVDREKKQMNSFFSEVKKCVQNKDSIFIFPEGTRNKTEQSLLEFQGGAQMIAVKNRLPILPIYIKSNANEILMQTLQNGKERLSIEVEVGDIIDYKDRSQPLFEKYKQQFNL